MAETQVESSHVQARYGYAPTQPDQIGLSPGDELIVIREEGPKWAYGRNVTTDREGLFPLNYTEQVKPPPHLEVMIAHPKVQEAEVSKILHKILVCKDKDSMIIPKSS